ncbi:MAG: hypothetical protein HRT56_00705 [Coraliomargarita sp.]|nr:hypothetical protein [Coraliomargarita sp.]
MAKLAIPEISLNKAARAVAGWSPCTHAIQADFGFVAERFGLNFAPRRSRKRYDIHVAPHSQPCEG